MSIGPVELLVLLVMLAIFVLPVWGIVDAAMRPDSAWAAAGQSKVAWILVQVFLWTLGAAVYFVAIRPKLKMYGEDRASP